MTKFIMRYYFFLIFFCCTTTFAINIVQAFVATPPPPILVHQNKNNHGHERTTTELELNRRDFLLLNTGIIGLLAVPKHATAKGSTFFYDDKIEEKPTEQSQMPTNGKLDLNSAFVGDYKNLPGMYPHAAGKIASGGPYTTVQDIYKIDGVTKNDIALFKKYESMFTVNPPGRGFYERINARVST